MGKFGSTTTYYTYNNDFEIKKKANQPKEPTTTNRLLSITRYIIINTCKNTILYLKPKEPTTTKQAHYIIPIDNNNKDLQNKNITLYTKIYRNANEKINLHQKLIDTLPFSQEDK